MGEAIRVEVQAALESSATSGEGSTTGPSSQEVKDLINAALDSVAEQLRTRPSVEQVQRMIDTHGGQAISPPEETSTSRVGRTIFGIGGSMMAVMAGLCYIGSQPMKRS